MAAVGTKGAGERNSRGDVLVKWATLEGLCLLNTQFATNFEQQWTHNNGINKKQIDYFLIEFSMRGWATNAEANTDLCVGMDHRCVRADLKILARTARKPRLRKSKGTSTWGWEPQESSAYTEALGAALKTRFSTSCAEKWDASQKCKVLEEVVVEVARAHERPKASQAQVPDNAQEKVKRAIRERKELKKQARDAGNTERITELSKQIQKGIRISRRVKKRKQVGQILADFKGLQKLADIRNNHIRKRLGSVYDLKGSLRTSRQGIVDAFADFYNQLYDDGATQDARGSESPKAPYEAEQQIMVSPITTEEVRSQLKQMKKRKAADGAALVAEMFWVTF